MRNEPAVILGETGASVVAIEAGQRKPLRLKFRELVASGGDGYEQIRMFTANGSKRHRFRKAGETAPAPEALTPPRTRAAKKKTARNLFADT